MGRGQWVPCGAAGDSDREISNVVITITDNAAVAEGQTITAVCNGKTFSSTIKNGIAKMYTSEVGTYTITAGSYNTMLVCPYFGQFSTDIYSGVLQVTCTEVGGSNKTCHVQSCDDEYNFTDDYNLTQTFDSSLGLTFMGIPTGRYLITVDERYRFFKEIISIQTVNESEVELKQWLYKNGDQCVHNTGGWMQCQCNGSTASRYPSHTPSWGSIDGKYTQSVDFFASALHIYQKCTASETFRPYSDGGVNSCARATVSSNAFCGTINKLPISVSVYSTLHYTATQPLTIALRGGEPNNTNTSASTVTVLSSGTAENIEICTINTEGMVVIGKAFYDSGHGLRYTGSGYEGETIRTLRGSLNYELSSDITEIYLV